MPSFLMIGTLILCFSAFHFVNWRAHVNNSGKLFDQHPCEMHLVVLNYKHAAGILVLGFIPPLFVPTSYLPLWPVSANITTRELAVFTLLVTLTILTALQLTEENKQRIYYRKPQLTSTRDFAAYFTLRTFFLISYEIFFRGFVLFGCLSWFGIWPAIVINITSYMLMHAFGDRREILACFPFGLILCGLCLAFESVLPAIVIHLLLSLTYEIRLYHLYLLTKKTGRS